MAHVKSSFSLALAHILGPKSFNESSSLQALSRPGSTGGREASVLPGGRGAGAGCKFGVSCEGGSV